MPFVDWNNPPASATAWAAAFKVLQNAANQAMTGTPADRQEVEAELTHFWTIPCPSPGLTNQARTLYNQLVLIDLGHLTKQAAVAPTAAAARAPQKAAPSEKQLLQKLLKSLDALQKQQQQALAAQLLLAQDIAGLRATVQQLMAAQLADDAK